MRRVKLALAALVAYAPALACLWLIAAHAVNLPTGDEWDAMVPAMVSLADGRFPWADVLRQDNEHRLVVPHLIQLGLATVTRYDNRVELHWGFVCLLGTSVLFLVEHLRQRELTPFAFLAFLPVNVVLFTWRQSENLIFAYQINVFTALFLAMATFTLLQKPTPLRIGFAAVTGVAAMFSHLLGLVVLPIGIVQLFVARRKLRAWIAIAIAGWVLHFVGYQLPAYHPDRGHVLTHPIDGAAFFLAALGNPWAIEPTTAVAVGLLLAAGYVVAGLSIWRERDSTLAGPAILFSIGCAALVAVGRAGYGDLAAALPLRYTTYATPGIVALYLWAIAHAPERARARGVLFAWLAVGFVATPAAMRHGLHYAREQAAIRQSVADALARGERVTDAQLALVCPWNPYHIRDRAPLLARVGWSVFRDAPSRHIPAHAGAPRHNIDIADAASPELVVEGWAVDAAAVRIGIDGVWADASYGRPRPDVAESLGNPAYRDSGFRAVLPREAIEPGAHRVTIEIVASDGKRRHVATSSKEVVIE